MLSPTHPPALQLPVTLLYDHQSVAAVVEYINGQLTAAAAAAAAEGAGGADAPTGAGADAGSDSDAEDITGAAQRVPHGRAGAAGTTAGTAAGDKPSDLLKLLRPPQAPRPLFLAAPGVANAQSAYFSFSQFLQVG